MPHSVSPEAQEPDAEAMAMDGEASDDASMYDDDKDNEMAMVETDIESKAAVEDPAAAKAPEKQEVKLEDLFADVESDEEFPSSNAPDIKMSSSPEAPASPMFVLRGSLLLYSRLICIIET
jgi:DNA primase small subunit